jgi:hypothetical protein
VLPDPAEILGAPRWLKPAKFAISTAIYAATFAWLLTFVRGRPRLVRWSAHITAWVFLYEVVAITLQAARGTTSHFNQTSAFNGMLATSMGAAIMVVWVMSIVIAVVLLRQRFTDRAFAWSLRLGLLITIAGAMVGMYMAVPTKQQLARAAGGKRVEHFGAHTVGADDGGPGLPGVGWSTRHGDLRAAHFAGLHALQVIPLLGWLFARRRRLSVKRRVAIVGAIGGSYFGLIGILFWQALRGQSLVQPDSLTLGVFAAWAVISGSCIALLSRQDPGFNSGNEDMNEVEIPIRVADPHVPA